MNNKISCQKELAFIGEDNRVAMDIVLKKDCWELYVDGGFMYSHEVDEEAFIDYLKHVITEIKSMNNGIEDDDEGGNYEDNECI